MIDEIPENTQTDVIADANIETWLNRLKASESYMKDEFLPKYQLARKRIRSEYEVEIRKGNRTHKQVNLAYSIGSNFINSVAPRNITVNLTARDEEETEKVENTEIKVNDFLKDKKLKRDIKRGIWDVYQGGFTGRFLDYEYQAVDDPTQMVDDGSGIPKPKKIVIKNKYCYKRIRPELWRFPKGFDFDNFQDSPFIAFDLLIPVQELKNYPQFDVNVVGTIKGKQYDDLTEEKSSRNSKSDILYAKLHYIFVKDSEVIKMTVLSDENKDAPLQPLTDFDKGQVGYPTKFLYFNPLDDDYIYPSGDVWLFEALLSAVDRWWKTMYNHVRRNNPKNLLDKGNIKDFPNVVQKLKNNEDMEYVGIETKNNTPIQNVTSPFQQPEVPKDLHQFYDVARSLLDEVAPKSSLSRGNEQSKDQKATVAQIIQANEMIDTEARADEIKEFIMDIVLDLSGMMEKSYVGEVEVSGKLADGTDVNRMATSQDFSSNINIDADIETLKPLTRDIKNRQILELISQLQLLEPQLNKSGKAVNFEFFIKRFIQNIEMRGADKAITDMNIKNPSKEHEEAVFNKVPMRVQQGEDKEAHLIEHYGTRNDQAKMNLYSYQNPSFVNELDAHIEETTQSIQAEKAQKQPNKPKPISDRATGVMA